MTFSHSRLAFADCFKLFDEAIASEKGIKFPVKSRKQAYHMRNRLNHARRIDRRDNKETYLDPTHPLHGRSVYDVLTVIMQYDMTWWLLIEKVEEREYQIQPITGEENNVEPELHNGGVREVEREETTAAAPIGRPAPVNPPPMASPGLRRL